MNVDPQIAELCRRVRITDYLVNRNVQLIKRGKKYACKCPLPKHPGDNDPSFYITTMADGTELFNCFGCSTGGNIITLIAEMESEKRGVVVKRISAQAGITLNKVEFSAKLEPRPDEVAHIFCEEQDGATEIAQLSVRFMQENPTDDVINKISRMYEMIDKFTRLGDIENIQKYRDMLLETIDQYY